MLNTARGLALILSAGIGVIGALLLTICGVPQATIWLVVFPVTVVGGFLLAWWLLNRFIFRPLEEFANRFPDAAKAAGDSHEPGERGQVARIIASIERLTAEKEREISRLRKLEALRKDFLADVSHELKTPIFAAQGFVHTLLDGAVNDKDVRKKFLKKAAKSLDGLDMLVQDLLTLSQIETGHIRMQYEEIDLYALTEDVFDQFKSKSDKKEIALKIEGPARRIPAYADWQRIRQVMTNLVANAIKHSGDGSEVVVSFLLRKKSVIVRVRDFGEGIPAGHTQRIFERFYRIDKSRSRGKGGTGLGLAIVKHILEGHNSVPEVESAPGKGSTFSFRLPRYAHDVKYAENSQPSNP